MNKDGDPKRIEGELLHLTDTCMFNLLPEIDEPNYPSTDSHVRAFYFDFATRPINIFVKRWKDETEVTAVCSGLRGIELQTMFHLAAPSKRYGVDYEDTLDDWKQLYNDPTNINRLKLHRRIPNWDIYENYRDELRRLIYLDYYGYHETIKTVHPVMKLRINNGEVSWNLDELDEKDEDTIVPNEPTMRMIPALGPLVTAAYSPQITSVWGKLLNYHLEESVRGTQDMGSTQAFPLTLAKADTLLDSSIIKNLLLQTSR